MNIDGGIHEIPLPGVAGRLWICGKHAIAPDPVALLASVKATHVVCLVQPHELADRYPEYVTWLKNSGQATWLAIHDLTSPALDDVYDFYVGVAQRLGAGETVIAHCAAGMGRAGTLAVAMCLFAGMNLDQAVPHVRCHRPGAGPEVGSQLDVVTQLAHRLGR